MTGSQFGLSACSAIWLLDTTTALSYLQSSKNQSGTRPTKKTNLSPGAPTLNAYHMKLKNFWSVGASAGSAPGSTTEDDVMTSPSNEPARGVNIMTSFF